MLAIEKREIDSSARPLNPGIESELQTTYRSWLGNPTPKTAGVFAQTALPIIEKQLTTVGTDKKDLLRSEAKLLLVDALPKYDSTRGVPLSNWLYTQLRPLSRLHGKVQTSMPIPERARQQLAEINRTARQIFDETGMEADDVTLADRLKISQAKIRKVRAYDVKVRPESSFVDSEGAPQQPGVVRPNVEEMYLDFVQQDLDPLNRRILEMARAGIPKKEIAARLSVSPAAISQRSRIIAAKVRAFEELRKSSMYKNAEREWSCLMLPVQPELANRLVQWGEENIPKNVLFHSNDGDEDGLQKTPHITIKYGLHTRDVDDVKAVIGEFGKVSYQLGKVKKFSGEHDGQSRDVIIVEASGEDLFDLNSKISQSLECTDKHPRYVPHVTLAYVKSGSCDHLVENTEFVGSEGTGRLLHFTKPDSDDVEEVTTWQSE